MNFNEVPPFLIDPCNPNYNKLPNPFRDAEFKDDSEEILNQEFVSINDSSDNIKISSPITRRGFLGFPNRKNKKYTDFDWYENYKQIENDLYAVENSKGSWIILDSFGNDILNEQSYDEIHPLNDGLIRVSVNEKFGFINVNGEIIHPLIYSDATSFYNNRAFVQDEKGWHIIDINGNKIDEIKTYFNSISDFSEDLAVVRAQRKYGYIDINGNVVIPLKYNYADSFSEGLACVRMDNSEEYFYIDKFGNQKIVLNATDIHANSEVERFCKENDSYLYFKTDEHFGLMTRKSEIVIQSKYQEIVLVDLGNKNILAKVRRYNKWGLVDTNGNEVVPCSYDFIGDTQNYDPDEGIILDELSFLQRNDLLTALKFNGRWGILNQDCEIVIPFKYDSLVCFGDNDILGVQLNGKWVFIDSYGKVIGLLQFEGIYPFLNGVAPFLLNGKYGLMNRSGAIIIPPLYYSVNYFEYEHHSNKYLSYGFFESDEELVDDYFNEEEQDQKIKVIPLKDLENIDVQIGIDRFEWRGSMG